MLPKMRKKWIHRELEALREPGARCLGSPPVGLGVRVEMYVDGTCHFVSSKTLLTSIYRFPFYASTAGLDTGSIHHHLSFIFLCPVIAYIAYNTRNVIQRAHISVHIVDEADTFLVPTPQSPSPPPPTEEGMEEDLMMVPEKVLSPSPQSPPPSPPVSPSPASPPSPAEEIIIDDEPPISSPETVVVGAEPPPPPPSPPPPPPVEELEEEENSIRG
jgi:hypothetical protein